jgi:site-specific recombinase XerD
MGKILPSEIQRWVTTAIETGLWAASVRKYHTMLHSVHDLRHAHASWLLAGGSDLKSVMDRMGHAQITTTQKYLHALPDADAKNLDALNRIRRRKPLGTDDATSNEEDQAD